MQDNLRRILTALAGLLYLVLLGYTITHHELWGDEFHSWNIVKASPSLGALFHNIRYEGHPPLWYLILYPITRVTHDPWAMQPVQFILASASVALLLFRSALPWVFRMLVPFGYFLLYEYAALSRNYAIGALLALCICMVLEARRFRPLLYYVLLFLLSNTHLLGLILAGSIHVYFLFRRRSFFHFLGFLVLVPALLFILPPGDSEMNTGFWLSRWNIHQLTVLVQAPLRAFIPMPAWWDHHWWNTQFLLGSGMLVMITAALVGLMLAFSALRPGGRILFGVNLLGTLLAGLIFPLTSARYTGFLFIGFLVAYWVGEASAAAGPGAVTKSRPTAGPDTRTNSRPTAPWTLCALLLLQIPGGLFAMWQDWKYPFSRANTAPELVGEVPKRARVVCDYWALNPLAAFTDRPYYCADLGETLSFLRWDGDFAARLRRPERYVTGTAGQGDLYLISTADPMELQKAAGPKFNFVLEDFRDGAIERGSNLYLYRVIQPAPAPAPFVQPVPQGHP